MAVHSPRMWSQSCASPGPHVLTLRGRSLALSLFPQQAKLMPTKTKMAKGKIGRKIAKVLGIGITRGTTSMGSSSRPNDDDVASHAETAQKVLATVTPSVVNVEGELTTDRTTPLDEVTKLNDTASTVDPAQGVRDAAGPVKAAHDALQVQLHLGDRTAEKRKESDKITPVVSSAVALVDPLLEKVKAFAKLIDVFAEIHPYAKFASSIVLSGIKAVIAQYDRDQGMIKLLQAMDTTYSFVSRAQDLIKGMDSVRKQMLIEMSVQTIQCAYFIQDQAKFRSFWRRMASNAVLAGAEIDSKIIDFTTAFENIRHSFTERTVLEGEIRMIKILEVGSDIQTTVDLLNLAHIRDAGLDSHKGCLPGTRERTIEHLLSWVNDQDGSKIRFLLGGAGTGKSSVAHSIGVYFRTLERLGSFIRFDRSSQSDRPMRHVVQTIARDLADGNKAFRRALARVMSEHRGLERSVDMDEQWRWLILEPLKQVTLVGPLLVVIDALDESASEIERRPLLKLLTEGAKDLPSNFRILITSRPDKDVLGVVGRSGEDYKHVDCIDLESYKDEARLDIARYVRHALAPIDSAFEEPLDDGDIQALTDKSEGLFQWAATACRAIREQSNGMTLKEGMDWFLSRMVQGGPSSLDSLYLGILQGLFNTENARVMERFHAVMAQILCSTSPLSMQSLEELRELATGAAGEVTLIVRAMGSLLSGVHTAGSAIRPHHTSFRDFLLDAERSRVWSIRLEAGHPVMARGCLSVMIKRLAFNMCGLETSCLFNREIHDLDTRIATLIPQSLSYAACNWQDHLPITALPPDLQQELDRFLREKLLFWFELLSLLGTLNRAARSLEAALAVYQSSTNGSRKGLLRDAIAFIRRFAGVIALSAAHAYVSALPFSPTPSAVRSAYHARFPTLPVVRGLDDHWPRARAVLSGHTRWVYAVAYSPDGRRVASGAIDGTVRIWDVETGTIIHVLNCNGRVWDVAFSPDGRRIAAACQDHRVRVWDSATWDAVGELAEGHESAVNCIAYSPNGKRIVSGDEDGCACVWSTETQSLVCTLAHGARVITVAYSPSGRHVASGGWDCRVRVWDADDGQPVGKPYEGHTGPVSSVLFSQEGRWIISGSHDNTIQMWEFATQQTLHIIPHPDAVYSLALSPDCRLVVSGSASPHILVWDLLTQQMVGEPLVGHSAEVMDVSFSPDGRYIVSGSHDNTVRIWSAEQQSVMPMPGSVHIPAKPPPSGITSVAYSPDGGRILSGHEDGSVNVWDANTGQSICAPLRGHGDLIRCIRFSPNGRRFVTASDDCTLRVWDSETLRTLGEPLGEHGWVLGVDFSPDGSQMVSCSSDRTLRIWDADTHQCPLGPLVGHADQVNCVAWSPDGTRIASASHDRTVRLWDPASGSPVGQPLSGHEDAVLSVTWSSDGQNVMSSSGDGAVMLWDVHGSVPAGKLLRLHRDRDGSPVYCVKFCPDGRRFVSAGNDGTSLSLWDLQTQKSIGVPLSYPFAASSESFAFSPDGHRIVSLQGALAVVWEMDGFTESPEARPSFTNVNIATPSTPSAPNASASDADWDGWIRDADGGVVMWVPEEYRESVRWRGMVMVLGRNHKPPTLTIDFTHASYGTEWHHCYQASECE